VTDHVPREIEREIAASGLGTIWNVIPDHARAHEPIDNSRSNQFGLAREINLGQHLDLFDGLFIDVCRDEPVITIESSRVFWLFVHHPRGSLRFPRLDIGGHDFTLLTI
jgi:hypothetical protein